MTQNHGASAVPQFWHISYPVPSGSSGLVSTLEDIGMSEADARMRAQTLSRRHGHATITNREGLVATYVNGSQWSSP